MKQSTLQYAKDVVDAQRWNYTEMVKHNKSKAKTDAQQAYYLGMKTMLEIILTDGYEKPLTEEI